MIDSSSSFLSPFRSFDWIRSLCRSVMHLSRTRETRRRLFLTSSTSTNKNKCRSMRSNSSPDRILSWSSVWSPVGMRTNKYNISWLEILSVVNNTIFVVIYCDLSRQSWKYVICWVVNSNIWCMIYIHEWTNSELYDRLNTYFIYLFLFSPNMHGTDLKLQFSFEAWW